MEAQSEVQLTVRLTTKLPDAFKVPETPLTVPGGAKRGALSKIVNHLLDLDPPRPFDFVVEGTLLRTTLHEHFADKGLSVEKVVVIEYIPVILPPKTKKSQVHDDWISAVNGRSSVLLTASYDGIVKGWDNGLESLWSLVGHQHPITCVAHVPQSRMFLTSSQDALVKAWASETDTSVPVHVATLAGHTDSVCTVAASPNGMRCCSVGWGQQINIWSCGQSLIEAEGEIPEHPKRQKRDVPNPNPVKSIQPLGQLHGHQGCVSDVIWPHKHTLFTAGWDHTVHKWDIQSASSTDTLTTHRVIHSIACPPDGSPVIALGSSDAILRLWDARTKSDGISLKLYRSHTAWISCLSWSPISDFHIASASYDHSVRVWDIRGVIPVVTCASHADKCLSVDWSGAWTLMSGGADCALHRHDVNLSLS